MDKLEIKDLLGLAEPVTQLVQIVSNAIGTLYEPRKVRKLADAEAYKIKKITDTAKGTDFNGEIEFLDGKITINSKTINNSEIKSLVANEVKRLFNENENIKKIADFAYNELENEKEKVKEEIDEDWKNNFFDKGRKIYSEDLQFIFGKILAGEIKQPGTYSKRLLGLLSNLSQKEANIFNKIAKYTLKNAGNSFIISDDEILKNFDVKLDEIILLEEAGLINSNPLTISNTNLYEYKNYLINFFDNKTSLGVYFLTKAGCELENIVNKQIDIDYLKNIKQKYNVQKMNYSVILSKIIVGDLVNYSLINTKDI